VLKKIRVDGISITKTESGVGPSDHTSFYLEDLPVLHFFTGQHDDYHKPSDDTEKVNFEGIVSVVKYMDDLITRLDDKGKLAFTPTKDEDKDSTPTFKVTLGIMPDYLFSGPGMRIDGVLEGKTAQKAGLLKGDIVHKMGDHKVTDMSTYMLGLSMFESGDTTTLQIEREKEKIEVDVIWD
jgi:C-terminal processing protease CtpA/Prc